MRYEPLAMGSAEFRERMERLRFGFGKWDLNVAGRPTVPPGMLVLERREHEGIVEACEALSRITGQARRKLAAAGEAVLGVDPRIAAAAAVAPDGPIVTRHDFFPTRDGWKVSEFNDDCPGGYNEAIGLPAVLEDAVPDGLTVEGDLPDALVRLVSPAEGPVALLYATGYSEDLQVVDLLARLLRSEGIETVTGSPANLEMPSRDGSGYAPDASGSATVLGDHVSSIFRFFPTEWLCALPNWGDWRRLSGTAVPVTNPLSTAYTQSKAIHAWLWDHAEGADRRWVERLLPRTRILDAIPLREARERPHGFVLKPAFGRMGESVTMGAECPRAKWEDALRAAAHLHRTRAFVLQDRFDAVPLETEPGQAMTACIGAYVVDGRFAGYYTRLARGPLVAYDAANVLTVVEGA